MSDQEDLTAIIDAHVAPNATEVDRAGLFPRAAIDALQSAGILALPVAERYGGAGLGLAAAADVVRRLGYVCGSTAIVTTMHYAATAALAATAREDALRKIGARRHLTTLAFSETGSRSHFWAPIGTATAEGDHVTLHADKSWVTSAHEADSYVWSSRPVSADGMMSLWFVPTSTDGLASPLRFDGLGLRGNDSCPVRARDVKVPSDARMGDDGAGLDIALSAVLPWFLLLNASASVGLMQAVTDDTVKHLTKTRLDHLDQSLAQQLPARTKLARMRIETDRVRTLVDDTVAAVAAGRDDAQLLVLEVKAAADEAAALVADTAMSACGGAAFRKELGIERRFRDSRAARVMAPTTDALLDFVGRAPLRSAPDGPCVAMADLLLGAVSYDPKVITIWSGFRAWLRAHDLAFDYVLYSNYERQTEDLIAGRIDVAWNSPLAWVRARRMAARSGARVRAVAMRDTDRDLVSVIAIRADSSFGSLDDLRGHKIAVGAIDSPQATLLPLGLLVDAGLALGTDVDVVRHDVGVGLHGDHLGGEREAASALRDGRVDAACFTDASLLMFTQDGTVPGRALRVLARTGPYDHCTMTAGPDADPDLVGRFAELLFDMSYADASVRPILDLEGLRQWVPGRVSGYAALERAVDQLSFYDQSGDPGVADYRP